MTISELIEKLELIRECEGDLDVVVADKAIEKTVELKPEQIRVKNGKVVIG